MKKLILIISLLSITAGSYAFDVVTKNHQTCHAFNPKHHIKGKRHVKRAIARNRHALDHTYSPLQNFKDPVIVFNHVMDGIHIALRRFIK